MRIFFKIAYLNVAWMLCCLSTKARTDTIPVHDPVIIRQDSTSYVFCTGADGEPWLSFGSFWNGIKLLKPDGNLTKPAMPEKWYTIADHPRNFILPDSVAGDAAIEAPFIFKKGDYYYLFVSFDYCCRAEKSTYKMVVGKSDKVYGPYVGRDGVPMNLGGGSVLLEGDKHWNGVGHNAVAESNGDDYLIFHAYDANDKGQSKAGNSWPSVTGKRNN